LEEMAFIVAVQPCGRIPFERLFLREFTPTEHQGRVNSPVRALSIWEEVPFGRCRSRLRRGVLACSIRFAREVQIRTTSAAPPAIFQFLGRHREYDEYSMKGFVKT
jgi:hypothetical protein